VIDDGLSMQFRDLENIESMAREDLLIAFAARRVCSQEEPAVSRVCHVAEP